MLSRTSARQQRMRQQTLNEERMAQDQLKPRTSNERRSSGSKLIISSPTKPSHLTLFVNTSNAQSAATLEGVNSKLSNQCNRGPGASLLLASLSGTGQRQANNLLPSGFITTTESAKQTQLSNFNSALISENYSPNQKPHQICGLASKCDFQNSTAFDAKGPVVYSQISNRLMQDIKQDGGGESASPPTGLASNSELSALDVDSFDSPTPSDMNSPVESCFANITGDQGSDSFDLNNITPSINLSSSVAVTDLEMEYSSQVTSSNKTDHLDFTNLHDSGIRINPVDVPTVLHRKGADILRDYRRSPKASSSCPADSHPLGMDETISPMLSNSSIAPPPSSTILSESNSSPNSMTISEVATAGSLPVGSGGGLALVNLTRNMDDQRVAWMRDRTKKDSHNRIERKRRDYINCQIAELGSLLPEDMFRDGDGKKNKGSILKNSVEFICLLRSELMQVTEIRKETNLAAKVIEQLVKRIQKLESIVNGSSNHANLSRLNCDYQGLLQEWLLLHEANSQNLLPFSTNSKHNLLTNLDATGCNSSPKTLSSSVGTDDLPTDPNDTRTMFSSNSPTTVGSAPVSSNPLTACSRIHSPISSNISRTLNVTGPPLQLMRTRCASLTVSNSGNGYAFDLASPSLRLPTTSVTSNSSTVSEQQRQLSQSARLRQQRVLNAHQPGQLRILQSSNQPVNHSQLRNSALQTRHVQQQQTSHVQPQLSSSNACTNSQQPSSHQRQQRQQPQHSSHVTNSRRQAKYHGDDARVSDSGYLSASLPVHVNSLLCNVQTRLGRTSDSVSEDQIAQIYSFDSNENLTQLKAEPPIDTDYKVNTDPTYSLHQLGLEMNADLSDSNTTMILEPVSRFDPIIASVFQRQQLVQQQQQDLFTNPSKLASNDLLSAADGNMDMDSPTNVVCLDVDDFQFNDIPME